VYIWALAPLVEMVASAPVVEMMALAPPVEIPAYCPLVEMLALAPVVEIAPLDVTLDAPTAAKFDPPVPSRRASVLAVAAVAAVVMSEVKATVPALFGNAIARSAVGLWESVVK
jgi:hypothetical protein